MSAFHNSQSTANLPQSVRPNQSLAEACAGRNCGDERHLHLVGRTRRLRSRLGGLDAAIGCFKLSRADIMAVGLLPLCPHNGLQGSVGEGCVRLLSW